MRHCVRGKKNKELEISGGEGDRRVYKVRGLEFLFRFYSFAFEMQTVTGLANNGMHMLLQEWLQIRG